MLKQILFLGVISITSFSNCFANFLSGVEYFEGKRYDEAAKVLYPIRKQGGVIAYAYLHHMREMDLVPKTLIPDDYSIGVEVFPEQMKTIGEEYLLASLSFQRIMNASLPVEDRASELRRLLKAASNGNLHAICLLDSLSKHPKDFSPLIQGNSKLSKLFKNGLFELISGVIQKYTRGPLYFLDYKFLLLLNQYNFFGPIFSLNKFSGDMKLFLASISKDTSNIADRTRIISQLSQHKFEWSLLALENGSTEVIPRLFEFLGERETASFVFYWFSTLDRVRPDLLDGRAYYLYAMYRYKVHSKVMGQSDLRQIVKHLKTSLDRGYKDGLPLYTTLVGNLFTVLQKSGTKEAIEEFFANVIPELMQIADGGHADAQVLLGNLLMYKALQGNENETKQNQDVRRAANSYEEAGKNGIAQGWYALGLMYLEGNLGSDLSLFERMNLGYSHFMTAFNMGHPGAAVRAAGLVLDGFDGKKDISGGLQLVKFAIKHLPDSQPLKRRAYAIYARLLAASSLQLVGKERDRTLLEAKKKTRKAADLGDVQSQFYFATLLLEGKGGSADPFEARKYLALAAAARLEPAIWIYATLLYVGEGGPIDELQARTLFENLAEKNPEATFLLGWMQYQGQGGLELKEAGLENISKAFRLGSVLAARRFQETKGATGTTSVDYPDQEVQSPPESEEDELKLWMDVHEAEKRDFKAKKDELKARQTLDLANPQALNPVKLEQNNAFALQYVNLSHGTKEFLKSVFSEGKGNRKFHTYTDHDAQTAFTELGCEMEPSDNGYKFSYSLGEKNRVSFHFHIPHPSHNLYNDLKWHFKRFLTTIGKVPCGLEEF